MGKQAEIRKLDGGNQVATFSLATSENWKDKNGERQTKTEWHNVVVWGKLSEVIERYTDKGSMIQVEGKIAYRSYEAKEGGTKYITEIIATGITLLGKKPESATATHDEGTPTLPEGSDAVQDDLPF